MCGIAGFIGVGSESLCSRMIEKISHRGPDGKDLWVSSEGEYPVALAHARLSVIDLSNNGSQPYVSTDKRHVFVFNGEIYNYRELRRDLETQGVIFQSASDTEVFLQGLILHGRSFLDKCNGMWAFCLYDRKNNHVLMGRDRFGVKPLYYTLLGSGSMAFASEMKALTILQKSIEPNPDITIGQDFFNYECTEQTVFRNIFRVRSGYIAEFIEGRIITKRWWSTLDHLESKPESYSEQVLKWKSIFFDSVAIRMRSDVRLGSSLSGGIDSSSVVATMHHVSCTNKLSDIQSDFRNAMCSSYSNSTLDEAKYAEEVSTACEFKVNKDVVSPFQNKWDIIKSLYQVEEPYLTYMLPMLSLYSRSKELGISVLLEGHGADEMFCGYGHLANAISCTSSIAKMKELIRIHESTLTGIYTRKERIKNRSLAFYYAKKLISDANSNLIKLLPQSDLTQEYQEILKEIRDNEQFSLLDPFTKILYELFHVTVLPTLLRNYDKVSMASGVELRMPFMDWRVVTYTFSLPWTSKVGGGYTKRIQRDSMEGILIDSIRLRRNKIGWNAPLHEWLKTTMMDEVEQIFSSYKHISPLNNKYSLWKAFLKKPSPTFNDATKVWSRAILPLAWKSCFDRKVFD